MQHDVRTPFLEPLARSFILGAGVGGLLEAGHLAMQASRVVQRTWQQGARVRFVRCSVARHIGFAPHVASCAGSPIAAACTGHSSAASMEEPLTCNLRARQPCCPPAGVQRLLPRPVGLPPAAGAGPRGRPVSGAAWVVWSRLQVPRIAAPAAGLGRLSVLPACQHASPSQPRTIRPPSHLPVFPCRAAWVCLYALEAAAVMSVLKRWVITGGAASQAAKNGCFWGPSGSPRMGARLHPGDTWPGAEAVCAWLFPVCHCRFNFDAIAASKDLSGLQTLPKRMLPGWVPFHGGVRQRGGLLGDTIRYPLRRAQARLSCP